jgi:hypothetical protein
LVTMADAMHAVRTYVVLEGLVDGPHVRVDGLLVSVGMVMIGSGRR